MAFSIKITTTGGGEFEKTLGLMIDNIKDFTPAFNQITTLMETHEKKTFDRSGSVDGLSKWAPLKDRNLAKKVVGFKSGGVKGSISGLGTVTTFTKLARRFRKPLIDTGALMRSFTTKGADGAMRYIFPKIMVFGSEIPYAGYHQDGTKKMVARPPLRISNQLSNKIVKLIQLHVMNTNKANRNSQRRNLEPIG